MRNALDRQVPAPGVGGRSRFGIVFHWTGWSMGTGEVTVRYDIAGQDLASRSTGQVEWRGEVTVRDDIAMSDAKNVQIL